MLRLLAVVTAATARPENATASVVGALAGLRGLGGPPVRRRLRRRRPGLRSWFVGPLLRGGVAAARRAWRGRARAEIPDRRDATAGDVCVIGLALLRFPFPPSRDLASC